MDYVEFKSKTIQIYESRRKFLKTSVIGGISLFCLASIINNIIKVPGKLKYNLSLESPVHYFDGEKCFVHARAGIVPCVGEQGLPRIVMTMNTQDLSGSDVYRDIYGIYTDDFGENWSTIHKLDNLEPLDEIVDGVPRFVALSDFYPLWHKSSKLLLGTGHTVVYTKNWKIAPHPRPIHTSYSFYKPENNKWAPWQKMEVPDPKKFFVFSSGSVQRYDKPDGTILLPIAFRPPEKNIPPDIHSRVTVVHCRLDDNKLKYVENGNELFVDDYESRGLGEASLTFFDNKYFMTIRDDKMGYVAYSHDGMNFYPIQPWKFDDSTDLGNYNTQQHWVTHSEGLFLVYTRRGANNDHVFRHRAPLFIAQVDTEKLCIIRDTEQILVPQRGARLGNFGVTDVSSNETWVTAAEWMQPKGCERYGSDGSVFIARINWSKPNRLFKE